MANLPLPPIWSYRLSSICLPTLSKSTASTAASRCDSLPVMSALVAITVMPLARTSSRIEFSASTLLAWMASTSMPRCTCS